MSSDIEGSTGNIKYHLQTCGRLLSLTQRSSFSHSIMYKNKIKTFSDEETLKNFTSHASFLKQFLENVFYYRDKPKKEDRKQETQYRKEAMGIAGRW